MCDLYFPIHTQNHVYSVMHHHLGLLWQAQHLQEKPDLISVVNCLLQIEDLSKLLGKEDASFSLSGLYYLDPCSYAFSINSSLSIHNQKSALTISYVLQILWSYSWDILFHLGFFHQLKKTSFMFPISAAYDPSIFQTNTTKKWKKVSTNTQTETKKVSIR